MGSGRLRLPRAWPLDGPGYRWERANPLPLTTRAKVMGGGGGGGGGIGWIRHPRPQERRRRADLSPPTSEAAMAGGWQLKQACGTRLARVLVFQFRDFYFFFEILFLHTARISTRMRKSGLAAWRPYHMEK